MFPTPQTKYTATTPHHAAIWDALDGLYDAAVERYCGSLAVGDDAAAPGGVADDTYAHHKALIGDATNDDGTNGRTPPPSAAGNASQQAATTNSNSTTTAATHRRQHKHIDDFVVRSVVEATLPLAPQPAKDTLLGTLGAYGGMFGKTMFRSELFNLFLAENKTDAADFLEAIAMETKRLVGGVAKGTAKPMAAAPTNVLPSKPLYNPTPLPQQQQKGTNNTSPASCPAPTTIPEPVDMDPPTYFCPTTATDRMMAQEASIIALQEEVRRLQIKCGERREGADASMAKAQPAASDLPPTTTATIHNPEDLKAIAALDERCRATQAALATANSKLEHYGGFYDRRGDVVHRARMLAAAAGSHANDNHSNNNPFPTQQEVRQLKAQRGMAALEAVSSVGIGGMHYPSSSSPSVMGSPLNKRAPANGAAAAAGDIGFLPIAAVHVQPTPSASPSRHYYGRHALPPPTAGDLLDEMLSSSPNRNRHPNTWLYREGRAYTSMSPQRGGSSYPLSMTAAAAQPNLSSTPNRVTDYSSVSVALPPSNLGQRSDTLLSMGLPLPVEHARQLLLGNAYGSPSHKKAGMPTGLAASPHRLHPFAAATAPHAAASSPGRGLHTSTAAGHAIASGDYLHRQQYYDAPPAHSNTTTSGPTTAPPTISSASRLDGMYHILGLERQETNRWRSYGQGYGGE